MDQSLLYVVIVLLGVPCLLVPLFKRVGLGVVLGYISTGILIGPFGLGLIEETATIMSFSEFGVVMMLFIIGLELHPETLWKTRKLLFGLGSTQVILTTVCIVGIALAAGWSLLESIVIGMALSLSSTAIAIQIMQERGMIRTSAGQSGFFVLLFQDLSVVGMLAMIPILTQYMGPEVPVLHSEHAVISHGPQGVARAAAILLAVTGMVLVGRLILRPTFRLIAISDVREVFTAFSLLVVVVSAALMHWLNLSAALGTFLAGMVLADCEYRHQLERDIEPFKTLLLGLFFMSVGMSLDANVVAAHPWTISIAVFGTITVKFILLLFVGRIFGLGPASNVLFASFLSQAGEFGFVILQFALSEGAVSEQTVAMLSAVIATSMAMTPLIILANDKWGIPVMNPPYRQAEGPSGHGEKVLILGFGRVGQVAVRLLQSQGIPSTIIDHDAEQIDFMRQYDQRVFYGDGADVELLRSAGAGNAEVIVIAIDDVDKVTRAASEINKHFPQAKIIARARNRGHLFDLLDVGVDFIERETIRGALAMGGQVLQYLGYSKAQADRLAKDFLDLDYKFAQDTYHLKDNLPALILRTAQERELLAQTLLKDRTLKRRANSLKKK